MRVLSLVAAAGLFFGVAAAAQSPDAQAGSLTPPTAVEGAGSPDAVAPAVPDSYRIGPADLVAVSVFQMPEFTCQVRVNPDGTIHVPLLDQPVKAAGNTPPELAAGIAADLQTARMARSPIVRVVVRQVVSHPIVISGAVHAPGVIQAVEPMSLLEVLSRAGGLQPDAGASVLLTTSDGVTREIQLQDVFRSASPDSNPLLTGGETIRVLPSREVYAVGAFEKPGGFPLQNGDPLTVLMAVALAGGVKNPADKSHATIIRNSAGQSSQIPVDLNLVLRHQAPDPVLEAGDIVYLPASRSGQLLGTATGIVAGAAVLGLGYFLSH